MRRVLVLASLACLLMALVPMSVQAAAATRTHEDAVILECGAPTDDGFISLFAVVSDQFESFGEVSFWETGSEPFEDAPTLFGVSEDLAGDATGMSGSFAMVTIDETQTPPEIPAGTATLDASFTPDGDPFDVDERFRNGNRWEKVTGVVQPLLAEGSVTLPGGLSGLSDLSGCFAAHQSLTFFSTNPSAFTDRFRNFFVSCSWEAADGSAINLFINADAFGAFGDVFIEPSGGGEIGGGADATVDETSFAVGPFDLQTFDEDGTTVGSAEASGTLASTGVKTRTTNSFFGTEKIFAELYTVDGTLDVELMGVSTTYPIDDDHCEAADQRVIVHDVRPAGPKPKPLANDTPEGAAAAGLGRQIRIVTGGNAEAPEAPCSTVYPGATDAVDVPITYTAWWTVTGTGGELTADTAGSDFDTVVGVYTMGPGGLEQVICVDDYLTTDDAIVFQAAASWDSTAGVTYWVQAGGYGGDAGHMELVIE